MKKRLRLFRHVFANLVIAGVVIGLIGVTASNQSIVASAPAPIYCGKSENKISLMINVYWGTEYIDGMLDTFEKYGVKTTFFIGGSWASKNEEVLKKIFEKGHELANHGYHHYDHAKLNEKSNYDEIKVTHELIKKITGYEPTLFAPPSGSFSSTTLKVAQEMGYTTVMWTRDTIDWRDHDTQLIYNRAVKDIKGGDLILMHPTHNTLLALDGILSTVIRKDLIPSTVSEVLN